VKLVETGTPLKFQAAQRLRPRIIVFRPFNEQLPKLDVAGSTPVVRNSQRRGESLSRIGRSRQLDLKPPWLAVAVGGSGTTLLTVDLADLLPALAEVPLGGQGGSDQVVSGGGCAGSGSPGVQVFAASTASATPRLDAHAAP